MALRKETINIINEKRKKNIVKKIRKSLGDKLSGSKKKNKQRNKKRIVFDVFDAPNEMKRNFGVLEVIDDELQNVESGAIYVSPDIFADRHILKNYEDIKKSIDDLAKESYLKNISNFEADIKRIIDALKQLRLDVFLLATGRDPSFDSIEGAISRLAGFIGLSSVDLKIDKSVREDVAILTKYKNETENFNYDQRKEFIRQIKRNVEPSVAAQQAREDQTLDRNLPTEEKPAKYDDNDPSLYYIKDNEWWFIFNDKKNMINKLKYQKNIGNLNKKFNTSFGILPTRENPAFYKSEKDFVYFIENNVWKAAHATTGDETARPVMNYPSTIAKLNKLFNVNVQTKKQERKIERKFVIGDVKYNIIIVGDDIYVEEVDPLSSIVIDEPELKDSILTKFKTFTGLPTQDTYVSERGEIYSVVKDESEGKLGFAGPLPENPYSVEDEDEVAKLTTLYIDSKDKTFATKQKTAETLTARHTGTDPNGEANAQLFNNKPNAKYYYEKYSYKDKNKKTRTATRWRCIVIDPLTLKEELQPGGWWTEDSYRLKFIDLLNIYFNKQIQPYSNYVITDKAEISEWTQQRVPLAVGKISTKHPNYNSKNFFMKKGYKRGKGNADDAKKNIASDKMLSNAINNACQQENIQTKWVLYALAAIESLGKSDIGRNRFGYTGTFQFGAKAANGVGFKYADLHGDDEEQVRNNAIAAARLAKANMRSVGAVTGKNIFGIYTTHQQGAGGTRDLCLAVKTSAGRAKALNDNQKNNIDPELNAKNQGNFYDYWLGVAYGLEAAFIGGVDDISDDETEPVQKRNHTKQTRPKREVDVYRKERQGRADNIQRIIDGFNDNRFQYILTSKWYDKQGITHSPDGVHFATGAGTDFVAAYKELMFNSQSKESFEHQAVIISDSQGNLRGSGLGKALKRLYPDRKTNVNHFSETGKGPKQLMSRHKNSIVKAVQNTNTVIIALGGNNDNGTKEMLQLLSDNIVNDCKVTWILPPPALIPTQIDAYVNFPEEPQETDASGSIAIQKENKDMRLIRESILRLAIKKHMKILNEKKKFFGKLKRKKSEEEAESPSSSTPESPSPTTPEAETADVGAQEDETIAKIEVKVNVTDNYKNADKFQSDSQDVKDFLLKHEGFVPYVYSDRHGLKSESAMSAYIGDEIAKAMYLPHDKEGFNNMTKKEKLFLSVPFKDAILDVGSKGAYPLNIKKFSHATTNKELNENPEPKGGRSSFPTIGVGHLIYRPKANIDHREKFKKYTLENMIQSYASSIRADRAASKKTRALNSAEELKEYAKEILPSENFLQNLFSEDLKKHSGFVSSITKPITKSMFVALLSLAYNSGYKKKSAPVYKIINLINNEKYVEAAIALGKIAITYPELANRRKEESSKFLSEGIPDLSKQKAAMAKK